ncbi:hypothetical protein BE20_08480 [Sorangium cellulosum]|uniref:Uncharacterized protein n=1 Tax=Sorangium cellulosum TaxID=56 RepID=A0A150TEG2_SORCE|nr:hypothetical protein BE20_08480 [Sorangium cellulosum]KYG02967.1 hypothetical protein BE18_06410 [Sorangium cellulosum]
MLQLNNAAVRRFRPHEVMREHVAATCGACADGPLPAGGTPEDAAGQAEPSPRSGNSGIRSNTV